LSRRSSPALTACPLFVEELTKAALEEGGSGTGGEKTLASALPSSVAVPSALHAPLMARLDRLGPAPKEVAQIAAAIGREFSYPLLAPVAARSDNDLSVALGRLGEAGLVFARGTPPEATYQFKHALVRDAAYASLLRRRREELHARIAAVLESDFPDIVETQPELVAQHFTAAGLAEPAIGFWHRAGQRSVGRSALAEAAVRFECRSTCSQKAAPNQRRDQRELELTLALVVPLIAIQGFGSLRVETRALRAKELSDKLPESPRRFAAQRIAWKFLPDAPATAEGGCVVPTAGRNGGARQGPGETRRGPTCLRLFIICHWQTFRSSRTPREWNSAR